MTPTVMPTVAFWSSFSLVDIVIMDWWFGWMYNNCGADMKSSVMVHPLKWESSTIWTPAGILGPFCQEIWGRSFSRSSFL
jgi:hypothetical protein